MFIISRRTIAGVRYLTATKKEQKHTKVDILVCKLKLYFDRTLFGDKGPSVSKHY